ncbi:MAG: hypothetical protein QOJ25_1692 [Solirubrobacteraceae bacterium]|jgi:hypothetical protein|nr:hypothetical protein [Solirubrobacteraceae bacterium]
MSTYATQLTHQRRRKVDDIMSAYVKWREASAHVWDADRRWRNAIKAEVPVAFRAYNAALDREELACGVYASLMTELP